MSQMTSVRSYIFFKRPNYKVEPEEDRLQHNINSMWKYCWLCCCKESWPDTTGFMAG